MCPGSSPRMRGAQTDTTRKQICLRIIPADAGSTQFTRFRLVQIWDHPRGCGEHTANSSAECFEAGSSPRMRGAPTQRPDPGADTGIIPADAGSTAPVHEPRAALRDHPRGCGEHGPSFCARPRVIGSSPRMRGALRGFSHAYGNGGIIPADAGSTEPKQWDSPLSGIIPADAGSTS